MRDSLARWIGDADAVRHQSHFGVGAEGLERSYIRSRSDDYFVSLVGELFDRMRADEGVTTEWARLGNALAQFGTPDSERLFGRPGVARADAILFAACAFYCGGFSASAYVTARGYAPPEDLGDVAAVCFDLLGRPTTMRSALGADLVESLRRGDMSRLAEISAAAGRAAATALHAGPDEWIPARLFEALLRRFMRTNLRAVLPDGGADFWTPLVTSLIDRYSWEFFPSQIGAIERGLLQSAETFSLQMPTGAGKTALCEALLYWQAKTTPDAVAVLLVPYRSLASELRETLVKRLTAMGISSRSAYGGTVPTGDEVRGLDDVRVMVATPEALSGVLSADPTFFRRIALAICDEGHLLDGGARGVSLELLLARMRAREGGAPRFVFVSAIVPNIEEINSWLGGRADTVVRSDYRPALAEFAVLRPSGRGGAYVVSLEMHPHEKTPTRFAIPEFLRRADFQSRNPSTGRTNTYPFSSVKTQAIATARKALAIGATAVFAANKRGNQGAVGLAEELLEQVSRTPALPMPTQFASPERVSAVTQYLDSEYGADWVGVRTLRGGAILHHGDIPQETREVLEGLLRRGDVFFVICTSTLAEGVNLPIRTLVLYSIERRGKAGVRETLLARDIKNLVGRAGRAGSTTQGLVVCANEGQWSAVEPVARQEPGEAVWGALRNLVAALQRHIVRNQIVLTNRFLESQPVLYTLIDGIDATLVDLATEEIGEDELVRVATGLADQTFASSQATVSGTRKLLQDVFALRARRVDGIRTAGRLDWIRDTGTRARMLDSVETDLLPKRKAWDDVTSPVDPQLVRVMIEWAWTQSELQSAIREAYRLDNQKGSTDAVQEPFVRLIEAWLAGRSYSEMAAAANLTVDDLLGVQTRVVGFVLQTLVEQAVAILQRLLESQGRTMAAVIGQLPDHLRFGVPTAMGRVLSAGGLRHRRAAVEIGNQLAGRVATEDRRVAFAVAHQLLQDDRSGWQDRLGVLVFERTVQDVA